LWKISIKFFSGFVVLLWLITLKDLISYRDVFVGDHGPLRETADLRNDRPERLRSAEDGRQRR